MGQDLINFKCSACGAEFVGPDKFDHCPRCGAEDGAEEVNIKCSHTHTIDIGPTLCGTAVLCLVLYLIFG